MFDSPVVSTKNLSIGYSKKKPLFKNLDLQLFPSSLTIITGENGVGKSTLLKTFVKILKPLDGDVCFNGKNLETISQKQLSQIVSVVLTDKLSSENLTVFDVISFGRTPYTGFWGHLSSFDEKIIRSVALELKIDGLLEKKISEISDGQKQKALIAKALVQQTEIIILDEPTAYLDFSAKEEIFSLLKKIAVEKNYAVLVSTHDIFSSLRYSDFIWAFSQGNVCAGKTNDIVLSNPMFKNISFNSQNGEIVIR